MPIQFMLSTLCGFLCSLACASPQVSRDARVVVATCRSDPLGVLLETSNFRPYFSTSHTHALQG
eukprot:1326861-Pyramimonas_sp.AAC.1